MYLHSHITRKKGHGYRLWPFLFFVLCMVLGACSNTGASESSGETTEAAGANAAAADTAAVATADSVQIDSLSQEFLLAEPVEWKLVVCGMLKARKVKDLKGLTVAISRFDGSDRICDSIVAAAGLNPADVYHPQIDSLEIRRQMLNHNQIDAAMLPLFLAQKAKAEGHRIITP